ncbi:MAG: DUF2336 domain-containing protein [Rhodospirillales bacterium]|jgi:uncharacterized protein (DUF2336 family)|nr:DUF2336 domain-containing protein [Rhodospirillales bacterium]
MVLNWVLGNVGKRKKKRKPGGKKKPPYDESKRIAASGDISARAELASVEDLEPEILYYFATDEAAEVRKAVATNEGTPLQADQILAGDIDGDVRVELARKIGRLVPTLSKDETDRLTQMAMEVLEILAKDDLPRVRATIAEEIKRAGNVPNKLVQQLARDVEDIVSAPILEYSPLLSGGDLLEIIAGGCTGGALVALSKRKGLSERISGAVFNAKNVQAVASLLRNQSAKISSKTMDMISVEGEETVEWHAPMVDRNNMPARVIRRIATFVSASLMDILIEKHKDQADVVEELRQSVRKRIERGDFAEKEPDWEPAEDRARKMKKAGKLTEDAVIRAMEVGDNAFVRYALVELSGLPFPTVTRLLNTGSGKAVTALVWKAGLSMATAFMVQQRISRVQLQKQMRPGPKGKFPISEEDLSWYIECVAE